MRIPPSQSNRSITVRTKRIMTSSIPLHDRKRDSRRITNIFECRKHKRNINWHDYSLPWQHALVVLLALIGLQPAASSPIVNDVYTPHKAENLQKLPYTPKAANIFAPQTSKGATSQDDVDQKSMGKGRKSKNVKSKNQLFGTYYGIGKGKGKGKGMPVSARSKSSVKSSKSPIISWQSPNSSPVYQAPFSSSKGKGKGNSKGKGKGFFPTTAAPTMRRQTVAPFFLGPSTPAPSTSATTQSPNNTPPPTRSSVTNRPTLSPITLSPTESSSTARPTTDMPTLQPSTVSPVTFAPTDSPITSAPTGPPQVVAASPFAVQYTLTDGRDPSAAEFNVASIITLAHMDEFFQAFYADSSDTIFISQSGLPIFTEASPAVLIGYDASFIFGSGKWSSAVVCCLTQMYFFVHALIIFSFS